MNKRAIVIAVVLFILIVAGMFMFAYMKRMELANIQPAPVVENNVAEERFPVTRIDAKHFFRNGTHTLAGELKMPTPCDLLTANAAIVTDQEEKAVINFDVINNSEGLCAQVITTQRFKVSFEGPSDIPMEARFNGTPIILNLIEAGPNENPDDFELFIKG